MGNRAQEMGQRTQEMGQRTLLYFEYLMSIF